MNIRVFPFLPLLMLLPAVISPTQVTYTINPSDLCPLIEIVEHELCNEPAPDADSLLKNASLPELCVLLHKCNVSTEHENLNNHHAMSDDAMSVRILRNEFYNKTHETHHNDIHQLCPIIHFIEQELCSSRKVEFEFEFEFDPKQLCPLLNLTYIELCD